MILLIVRLWRLVWRWVRDQYRRLSARRRVVILASVLPPVLFLFLGAYLSFTWMLIAYVLWGLVLAPCLASAMNHDSASMEHFVDDRVNHLSKTVTELREDLEHSKVEFQQEVNNLESFLRTSLAERGIVLPPRPVILSVDAAGAAVHVTMSEPTLTVGRNMSLKGRLRRGIQSAWDFAWKYLYGTPEDR